MKSFLYSLFLHATLACSVVFGFGSLLDNGIQGGRAGGSEGSATSESSVTNIQLTYLINDALNSESQEITLQALSSSLAYDEKNSLEEEKIIEKEVKKQEIPKKEALAIKKKPNKKEVKKEIKKNLPQKTQNKTKNIQSKENTKIKAQTSKSATQTQDTKISSPPPPASSKTGTDGIGTGIGQGIGAGDAIKDVPFGSGTGAHGYLSKVKSLKKPPYPEISRQAGEEGTSEIIVQISNGKLQNAQIHASSGFSRLDNAALKAVKKAKFAPFSGNLIIPIVFTLRK